MTEVNILVDGEATMDLFVKFGLVALGAVVIIAILALVGNRRHERR